MIKLWGIMWLVLTWVSCSSPQENSGGWVETENSVAIVVMDSLGKPMDTDSLIVLMISYKHYLSALQEVDEAEAVEFTWDTLRVTADDKIEFSSKDEGRVLFKIESKGGKNGYGFEEWNPERDIVDWELSIVKEISETKAVVSPQFLRVNLLGHSEVSDVSDQGYFSFNNVEKGSYRALGWNGEYWQYIGNVNVIKEGLDFDNNLFTCLDFDEDTENYDFDKSFMSFPDLIPKYSILAENYGIDGVLGESSVDKVEARVTGTINRMESIVPVNGEFYWVLNDLGQNEELSLRFEATGYAPACIELIKN